MARSKAARTETLRDCALVEVQSSYGLGYMDDLSGRYRPKANLAGAAVRLADMIDLDGRYAVDNLHTSDLPAVWFTTERRTGTLPARACVSVSAPLRGSRDPWSHGLLVFLAEMARSRAATELAAGVAAASTEDRPRVATALDRRVVLIIGGSSTHGEAAVETTESLARYRDLAAEALDGA